MFLYNLTCAPKLGKKTMHLVMDIMGMFAITADFQEF